MHTPVNPNADRPATAHAPTDGAAPRPPGQNALKHGLRSAAILLPGDDEMEFFRLRRDLFQTYRPRTPDEAQCVEAMAGHHWRMARYRRWQAVYDAQTDALLTGDPSGLAGHICEPDPHRWMHKSMDCTLQEGRLDRLLGRAREKLLLLQKLRRNNLILDAVEMSATPWSFQPPAEHAVSPREGAGHGGNGDEVLPIAGEQGGEPVPATPSPDGEKDNSSERTLQPEREGLGQGLIDTPHPPWHTPPTLSPPSKGTAL